MRMAEPSLSPTILRWTYTPLHVRHFIPRAFAHWFGMEIQFSSEPYPTFAEYLSQWRDLPNTSIGTCMSRLGDGERTYYETESLTV